MTIEFPALQAPQPIRLAEMAFERISTAILDGSFTAGDALRDSDIAAQLGVSRMPVREALQRLQRIGLVDMAPSRFTRVAEVTPEIVAQTLHYAQVQAGAVVRRVLPTLELRQRRDVHVVIKDVLAQIAQGAPALATANRVYRHLAQVGPARFMEELVADIDIAVEHNLRHADDSEAVRAHVTDHLVALDAAITRGDIDGAAEIAGEQHLGARAAALVAAG